MPSPVQNHLKKNALKRQGLIFLNVQYALAKIIIQSKNCKTNQLNHKNENQSPILSDVVTLEQIRLLLHFVWFATMAKMFFMHTTRRFAITETKHHEVLIRQLLQ